MNPQAQPVRPASSFELRHLRYFLAVTEELNFTRAARKLNVVQQTLSEGIAQLEDVLGLRLFERATRPVGLTDAAVRWLPYALEALEAAERAQDAARDLRSGHTARLRVGLAATAAFPLTPVLLDAFRDRHPQVALSTRHFDFGDPAGGLLTGHADVAIVRPPFTADGLELLVIASEPRYVALSDQHPLACRASVAFADALALREAIDAVVLATVSGTAPPGQALSDLNDWLSLMPGPSPLLRRSGDLVTFDTGPRDQGVRAVLAPIALDAAQLVGSDLRSRLRICPGARCGGRFLDRSAGGRRRWCSMAVCGNRSKASSHRHATAQSLSGPAG